MYSALRFACVSHKRIHYLTYILGHEFTLGRLRRAFSVGSVPASKQKIIIFFVAWNAR